MPLLKVPLLKAVISFDLQLIYICFYFIGPWVTRNSSIDSGETEVGRKVTQEVPPGVFWRSQIHISQPQFLKFNISLGKDALFGVYIRRGLPPSHAQVLYPCISWLYKGKFRSWENLLGSRLSFWSLSLGILCGILGMTQFLIFALILRFLGYYTP